MRELDECLSLWYDCTAIIVMKAAGFSDFSSVKTGSSLKPGSRFYLVNRGKSVVLFVMGKKDILSGFNLLASHIDAPRIDLKQNPLIEDTQWFFDTELLVLADRAKLRISEIPVDWVDDPDSRVNVTRTALDDLKGVARMEKNLIMGRYPLRRIRNALIAPLDTSSVAAPPQYMAATA